MNTDETVTKLVPNRPDADVANELRQRVIKAFEPIVAIMDEAIRVGLVISWGGVPFNPQTGHHVTPPVDVSRHY